MKSKTKKNIRFFFIIAFILFIFFGYYRFEKIMARDHIDRIYNMLSRIFYTTRMNKLNPYVCTIKKNELFLYFDNEKTLSMISTESNWTSQWEKEFPEKGVYGIFPNSKGIIIGAGDQSRFPGNLSLNSISTSGKITKEDIILPPEAYLQHMTLWEKNEVILFAGIMNKNKATKDIYTALLTLEGKIQKETTFSFSEHLQVTHSLITTDKNLIFAAVLTNMPGSIYKVYLIHIDHTLETISNKILKLKNCHYITGLYETDGEIVLTGGGYGDKNTCLYKVPLNEFSTDTPPKNTIGTQQS